MKINIDNTPQHFDKEIIMFCWTCGKQTKWNFDLAYINYWGIRPIIICEECGNEVPDFAIENYKTQGKVIIPV